MQTGKDVELDGCKDDFISFLTAFPTYSNNG